MARDNRTKDDFQKDKDGRTILGTANDMARWVELGYEEQKHESSELYNIQGPFIDLRNCNLFVSYPIGGEKVISAIFNFCDIAGVVPDTSKDESPKNDYFYVVDKDIRFDNSILRGGFFHYVWFKGSINLLNTKIGTCSFFKCRIDGVVWIANAEFSDLTIINCCFSEIFSFIKNTVNSLNVLFDNCEFVQSLRIVSSEITQSCQVKHGDRLLFRHCRFHENTYIEDLKLNGNPLIFDECTINGLSVKGAHWEDSLLFINNCALDGISLFSNQKGKDSKIGKFTIWSTKISGQMHIEGYDITELTIGFSEIESNSRVRIYKNDISILKVNECSIHGRFDVADSKLMTVDYAGSICTGIIDFEECKYDKLANLPTTRLLKNQANKLNDIPTYLKLYRDEMDAYENSLSWKSPDKVMLRLNKLSNDYGQSWMKGIAFTLLTAIIALVLINLLGRTSGIPPIVISNEGIQNFISDYLSVLNVFNIIRWSKESLDLNGYGLFISFLAKILISYGGYQTIVAFRRLNQKK